jgi:hypothetical protein
MVTSRRRHRSSPRCGRNAWQNSGRRIQLRGNCQMPRRRQRPVTGTSARIRTTERSDATSARESGKPSVSTCWHREVGHLAEALWNNVDTRRCPTCGKACRGHLELHRSAARTVSLTRRMRLSPSDVQVSEGQSVTLCVDQNRTLRLTNRCAPGDAGGIDRGAASKLPSPAFNLNLA